MSQSAHEYGFATRGANVRATMHAGTREVHSAREGKGGAERCSADSDDGVCRLQSSRPWRENVRSELPGERATNEKGPISRFPI